MFLPIVEFDVNLLRWASRFRSAFYPLIYDHPVGTNLRSVSRLGIGNWTMGGGRSPHELLS